MINWFQSLAGFLARCDMMSMASALTVMFQSLSGFLARCDCLLQIAIESSA